MDKTISKDWRDHCGGGGGKPHVVGVGVVVRCEEREKQKQSVKRY